MDSVAAKEKWNQRYHSDKFYSLTREPSPSKVLLDFQHLLPIAGPDTVTCLDLACGLGGNALFLASHGFETHAWDISDVAIDKLNQWVIDKKLKLHTQVRDVLLQPPLENQFDVIVVSRFLERSLCADLMAALTAGGLLYYQTFVQDKVDSVGPENPQFLLQQGELLHLFSELNVLAYRDEGSQGDVQSGFRNEALLVAQKPV